MSPPGPVTLTLGPEEVSALRKGVVGYLALGVYGPGRHVLEELSGLFVSWERKGLG